jgi:hypothetical protein
MTTTIAEAKENAPATGSDGEPKPPIPPSHSFVLPGQPGIRRRENPGATAQHEFVRNTGRNTKTNCRWFAGAHPGQ